MSENELKITIQPTPNPNALKFILSVLVKNEGKSTYETVADCGDNLMAASLFTIRGVDQLHFYQNVITISKFNYIIGCLREKMPSHDPDFEEVDPEEERRKNLSPELLKIEEILDHTIRPGLQADGGDLVCLSMEENILVVKYEGACGTCPSSTGGTLEAIKGILRDQYNPEIEVYIAP
jgi:Fe-S cluster biogenesis protein NfuA